MLFGRKNQKPIRIPEKKVAEWKYSTCNYCSTSCSIEIGMDDEGNVITCRGHAAVDVNRGKLCIKGLLKHELFDSDGRGIAAISAGQSISRIKAMSIGTHTFIWRKLLSC